MLTRREPSVTHVPQGGLSGPAAAVPEPGGVTGRSEGRRPEEHQSHQTFQSAHQEQISACLLHATR